MEFNPQKQLAGLLEWMDQQMTLCHGKTAVIGISGGKDSSTVAALAVAAYGRENVYGVLMPNGVQPDIDYSQALVEHLNIPHCTINIHDAVQGVLHEMEQAGLEPSRQTRVNLPSRIRMATLYAVAQTVPDGIVINTSNLSEDWVGYCTIYGDSAGAFSPLGMYTTEEVIALGRVLGLPEKFLVKAPPTASPASPTRTTWALPITPSTNTFAGASATRPSADRPEAPRQPLQIPDPAGVSQRFAHGPYRRDGLLQISAKHPGAALRGVSACQRSLAEFAARRPRIVFNPFFTAACTS